MSRPRGRRRRSPPYRCRPEGLFSRVRTREGAPDHRPRPDRGVPRHRQPGLGPRPDRLGAGPDRARLGQAAPSRLRLPGADGLGLPRAVRHHLAAGLVALPRRHLRLAVQRAVPGVLLPARRQPQRRHRAGALTTVPGAEVGLRAGHRASARLPLARLDLARPAGNGHRDRRQRDPGALAVQRHRRGLGPVAGGREARSRRPRQGRRHEHGQGRRRRARQEFGEDHHQGTHQECEQELRPRLHQELHQEVRARAPAKAPPRAPPRVWARARRRARTKAQCKGSGKDPVASSAPPESSATPSDEGGKHRA